MSICLSVISVCSMYLIYHWYIPVIIINPRQEMPISDELTDDPGDMPVLTLVNRPVSPRATGVISPDLTDAGKPPLLRQ